MYLVSTFSLIALLLLFGLTGCAATTSAPHRQWIIGFGWVDCATDVGVHSDSLSVCGLAATRQGLIVGLAQRMTTTIDPHLQALVEVQSTPFKTILRTKSILQTVQ